MLWPNATSMTFLCPFVSSNTYTVNVSPKEFYSIRTFFAVVTSLLEFLHAYRLLGHGRFFFWEDYVGHYEATL